MHFYGCRKQLKHANMQVAFHSQLAARQGQTFERPQQTSASPCMAHDIIPEALNEQPKA